MGSEYSFVLSARSGECNCVFWGFRGGGWGYGQGGSERIWGIWRTKARPLSALLSFRDSSGFNSTLLQSFLLVSYVFRISFWIVDHKVLAKRSL